MKKGERQKLEEKCEREERKRGVTEREEEGEEKTREEREERKREEEGEKTREEREERKREEREERKRIMVKDINSLNHAGATPLLAASQNGRVEFVQMLLDKGAKVDLSMMNGTTPLYVAALKGHGQIVQILLQNGANVDAQRKGGTTPLYIAAQEEHLEIVQFLLENGAKVDAQRENGTTPLLIAAQNGHFEIVQMLLKNGAKLDSPMENGTTPLYVAACYGHQKIVQILLEKGAKVDILTKSGATPLYIAAHEGRQEVVQILLEKGAKVNAPRENGATPLYAAAQNGHGEIVQILLKKGAKVNAPKENGATPLFVAAQHGHQDIATILLENGAKVEAQRKSGETPLIIAAEDGHEEVVQILLEKGANIDGLRQDGGTPLFVASQNGYKGVVQILLKNGAKVDTSKKNGVTPLFIAAQKGHKEIIQILLRKGANIHASMEDGATPLFIAAQKGHEEVVRFLLEKGANIDVRKGNGVTPLYVAAQNGHREVVKTLLEEGPKVDSQRGNGATPLFVAAEKGHREIVQILLEEGANIEAQRKGGATPLHIAAENGHTEIIHLLLDQGVNVDILTEKGATALSFAVKEGKQEIVEILLEKGAKVDALLEDGTTPLYFAVENMDQKIVQILLENGANVNIVTKPKTEKWVSRKKKFAESYLPPEKFPPFIPTPLYQLVLESMGTGILDLKDPALGITDEMLDNIQWPQIGPFLTHVLVNQRDVTSLPLGLAFVSLQSIQQIQFVTGENWRKLDKIKAGESDQSIIEYCKAKLEGGMVKMKALRLMVMGGPAVGKTTMIRRLRDKQAIENLVPLSTDGVELGDVKLSDGTILETWDFGGQKIYRISHQLFLRDFCLYAVLCRVNDALEDALKELRFWIESVLSRTEKAQILLITTHGDRLKPNEAEAAHDYLHRSLISQYGEEKIYPQAVMLQWTNKSFFHQKSKDKGMKELKRVLLKMSDQVAFDAPASLEMIRVALESLECGPIVKISLVHRVVLHMGEQKGIEIFKDEERRLKLLCDLDTLGYIYLVRPRKMNSLSSLNSTPSDQSTEMVVVLNPQWISRLLATLITTKHSFAQSAGGVIDHDTLTHHLWRKEEDFPKKYHEDMITLLIQLHIMFPLRSPKQQKYFVPCLLKEDEPQYNHGIESEFGFRIGGQNRVVLDRILRMKNRGSVPVAVMPMVIVQLMKIGEVIECWQQGCAVAIYSSAESTPNMGGVECCCLVKRKRGDELNIKLEGVSSEVAGWWMKEVMRSLENMLEEFYHIDYVVEVMYHGEGGGVSCSPCCRFQFSNLYKMLAQRKVTALCQNMSHDVALQYLVPDLLIREASSLSLVSWEELEIEKELGQGSFGKVLLCLSAVDFQKKSGSSSGGDSSPSPSFKREKKKEKKKREEKKVDKQKEKKRKEKKGKRMENGEEEDQESSKFAYAVKVLEPQKWKDSMEEGGLQKDFLLEVYTMTGLVHPNIVRLVGITHPLTHSPKNIYHQNHAMVMELVDGGDLYGQINYMGLNISGLMSRVIKFVGSYHSQLNLHIIKPSSFPAPESLPPLSLICDCAFPKIQKYFDKWLSIAGGSHGKQIKALRFSLETGIKRFHEGNFEREFEKKRVFDDLQETANKIEDLICETTEIYAPLPWVLCLKIAFDIARGIHYLHSFNPPIIHRDLKSPNIFLSRPLILFPINEQTLSQPLAKVGDFGWAVKLLGASSLVGGKNSKTECVTATWASPEMLNGEEFTEKIDIYAIGIMLWELLVRQHPFFYDLEVELMEVLTGFILKKGRPSIPSSLLQLENETNPEMTAKYLALMNRCWDHQPSCRPTALEVCESLREMMQGEALMLGGIVDKVGVLDLLKKENDALMEDTCHYSLRQSPHSLSVSTMKVSDMLSPKEGEKWKVKRVLFAGLDWLWIGFWNGYVGVVEVKKAFGPGGDPELILCHQEDKHKKEVRAMVYQSVGGHVWTSSMCGTLQVWRDAPLTREDAIEHFHIKGWLKKVSLVRDEDIWVTLDTGRLRLFKHQYFGIEEDSIPINKNTVLKSFLSTRKPAIQVQCPEENKTFKFAACKVEENSPSLSQWLSGLEQFIRMLSFDLSLLRLGLKQPENYRGVDNGGGVEDEVKIGFLGLEAVGHSVWGFTTSFQVVEFTLVTVEDEHGLHRRSRVETKRRLKLDQDEIDVRFQSIGRSGLVSMGKNTLCLAIGNAVGTIHTQDGSEKMSVEWCQEKDRGGSYIRCLTSVWNRNWAQAVKKEEEEEEEEGSIFPPPRVQTMAKQGPELWAYDGEKILIFRSKTGDVHQNPLILVDEIEVPSDNFLSCLTQVRPNEIWGGTAATGTVMGWKIDTRSLLPYLPLSEEEAHDGNVSSLAAPIRVVGADQKISIIFSASTDGTLRLFCYDNS